MKYFLDTEFIEGTQPIYLPFTNLKISETKPTIDLISIGIVTETGREFYEISKDFNLKEAWNRYDIKKDFGKPQNLGDTKIFWLRENVLKPIWRELFLYQECDYALLSNKQADQFEKELATGSYDHLFTYKSIKGLLAKYGKTNLEIAEKVKNFIYATSQINEPDAIANWEKVKHLFPILFYADYCSYDWVVFCWLFGKMNDLPKGFPMYCNDLQQLFLEKIETDYPRIVKKFPTADYLTLLKTIQKETSFPTQKIKHHALYDAHYDRDLYKFIQKL